MMTDSPRSSKLLLSRKTFKGDLDNELLRFPISTKDDRNQFIRYKINPGHLIVDINL